MKDKTTAMRKLNAMKVAYKEYDYSGTGAVSGTEVAKILRQNPERVFKTLATMDKDLIMLL